jgi:5-methyltetrahydropteroyltriglutamate--homocysteine methyltransferase
MATFKTQEIGSLKKPNWLLDYLKSRASDDEKKEALNEAAFLNVKMLENIGLDFVYDGEVRRIEMYELPVKNIEGFEFAGRVRSWDNRYYKKARVTGEVKYRLNYHLEEFLYVKSIASKIPKVPVTGAYTIMDWSYNEFYKDRSELAFELSKVVRRVMSDLSDYGAPVLQIDEPAATTHPDEMDMFVDVFNEQAKGINAKISTHICYSGDEYSSLMPRIAELKASHFALEFANRDKNELGVDDESRPGYRALKAFREYGNGKEIGLGVLDVHTDFIELPELIRDRILYAVKILGDYSKIYINPDCGLRTRQRKIAFEKLKSMMEGVKMAESAIH